MFCRDAQRSATSKGEDCTSYRRRHLGGFRNRQIRRNEKNGKETSTHLRVGSRRTPLSSLLENSTSQENGSIHFTPVRFGALRTRSVRDLAVCSFSWTEPLIGAPPA